LCHWPKSSWPIDHYCLLAHSHSSSAWGDANVVLCAQKFVVVMGFWVACLGFGIPYSLLSLDPLSTSEIETQGVRPTYYQKKELCHWNSTFIQFVISLLFYSNVSRLSFIWYLIYHWHVKTRCNWWVQIMSYTKRYNNPYKMDQNISIWFWGAQAIKLILLFLHLYVLANMSRW